MPDTDNFPDMKISIDYAHKKAICEYDGMTHNQDIDEPAVCREKLLSLLDIRNQLPSAAQIDTETSTVLLSYKIPGLKDMSLQLLEAAEMSASDMSNVVSLLNAYINNQISKNLLIAALSLEQEANMKNEAVTAMLDTLPLGKDPPPAPHHKEITLQNPKWSK